MDKTDTMEGKMTKEDAEVSKKLEADYDAVSVETDSSFSKKGLTFGVRDNPPLHISFIYALQIVMSHIHGPLSAAFVVHNAVCGGSNRLLLAHIFATSCFLTGLCTIIQVSLGLRLPVTQVSSSAFLPPIIALMSTKKCPTELMPGLGGVNGTTTIAGLQEEDPWLPRIQEISGGLILASLIEVALGMLGLVGLLMRFIGPLTIGACVSLVSISLVDPAIKASKPQWGIAAMTVGVAILCSQVLGHLTVPVPVWDRKVGVTTRRFPLVKMFAHLFAYGLPWLLCFVLTVTNVFPDDPDHPNYGARTDAKADTIQDMQWFYVPYPGQWGAPRFGAAIFIGMFSATISSVLESVGDYYATARVCDEQDPPKHAVNRGITMEGVGGILSGLFGLGYNTTSYSNCVGMITYTGVASRVSWYITGVMFILMAVVGKVAAALATVPEPILGGSMTLSLAMVLMVGLSNLQFVKINSVRNQTVLGLSIMVGIMLPRFMAENPGAIKTGSSDLDQAISVILQSGPCIGGILAALLDNLLPGTKEERGMVGHHSSQKVTTSDVTSSSEEDLSIYDIPFLSKKFLRKFRVLSFIPFLPSYDEDVLSCKSRGKRRSESSEETNFHQSKSTTCLVEEGISNQYSTKF